MKPHIWWCPFDKVWVCRSGNRVAYGHTPAQAYANFVLKLRLSAALGVRIV